LKKVLQTSQVIYTSEKARIIDIPYKSDLEPWLKDGGGFDGVYTKMLVLKAIGDRSVTEGHIFEQVGDNQYTRESLRRLMELEVVQRGSNDLEPRLYTFVRPPKSADGASGKKGAHASSRSNGKKSGARGGRDGDMLKRTPAEDKDLLKRIQIFLFGGAKSAEDKDMAKSADGASGKKGAHASSRSNGKKSGARGGRDGDMLKRNPAEDKDMLKRIQKKLSAKAEAQCTLNTCANIHPWSVRGTLHPWKTYQDGDLQQQDLHTGECQICDGRGGKDGGLFTGETLLHIAIVQHDHQMVKWLLDGGASLDARALGVFFQRPRIDRFTSDQTPFPFTLLRPKEQQADKNNFFRYLFQCLNRNT
jgi:hypothetical protein